jgi:hypothetical protein
MKKRTDKQIERKINTLGNLLVSLILCLLLFSLVGSDDFSYLGEINVFNKKIDLGESARLLKRGLSGEGEPVFTDVSKSHKNLIDKTYEQAEKDLKKELNNRCNKLFEQNIYSGKKGEKPPEENTQPPTNHHQPKIHNYPTPPVNKPSGPGYKLHLVMDGKQDLAQLKIDYPVYFGWLADSDTIYKSTVTLEYLQDGYVKGQILPVDRPGQVLWMYNGYQPRYNDEEFLNDMNLPADFQFKGFKGETKTWYLYTTKIINKSYGRYTEIEFIPIPTP